MRSALLTASPKLKAVPLLNLPEPNGCVSPKSPKEVESRGDHFAEQLGGRFFFFLVWRVGKKYVVLYTYPADFTFVCASELVTFSQMQKEFEARDVQVLGLSVDTQHVHKAGKGPRDQVCVKIGGPLKLASVVWS